MPGRQDSHNDSSQLNDLTAHLREDKELRSFIKQFLTTALESDQGRSLEKILSTGLPVVSDSAESSQERPKIATAEEASPAFNLTPEALNALLRAQAGQAQAFQASAQQFDKRTYAPPFDEALLPQPERFVDREAEFDRLVARLRQGGTIGITALRGMGGIGKTALAAKAAEKLRADRVFPDGIAVALCQEATDPVDVLRRVLSRFDPVRHTRPGSLDDLSEAARLLLHGKKALIILDNVEPDLAVDKVVRPLREAGVTVLITARQLLSSAVVPAEGNFAVDVLPPEKALELLTDAYQAVNAKPLTDRQQRAATRIVEALGWHTLAIRVAGAYAANVGRDLEALAEELHQDAEAALSLPDGERPDSIQWLFQQSTDALPPDAKTLFFALPAFHDTQFGRNAAIALARALELTPPRAAVDLLVTRSLLEASPSDALPEGADRERLRLHLLLRAVANERFMAQSVAERNRAYRAVADYFARYLQSASEDALDAEYENIVAAITWADAQREWRLVVDLCLPMRLYWQNRSLIKASEKYLPRGIAAAEQLLSANDSPDARRDLATLHLANAQTRLNIAELDAAEAAFTANLTEWESLRDPEKQAVALDRLGQVARARSQLAQAETYFQRSLEFRRLAADHRGEGAAYGFLGRIAQARGEYDAAKRDFEQSLAIAREQDDHKGVGRVLNSLGQVALARGEMEQAERYFNEAKVILHAERDRPGENDVATGLGRLALDRGDLATAETIVRQCLEVDKEIMDRQGRGADLSLLAQIAVEREDFAEARRLIAQSLLIRDEAQDSRGRGVDLSILGRIALEEGDLSAARTFSEEALVIARQVGNRRGEGATLHQLGRLALASGDLSGAARFFEQSLEIATDLQSTPDMVRANLSLGEVAARAGDTLKGRQLVSDAIERYQAMNRGLDLRRAQATAQALGRGEA